MEKYTRHELSQIFPDMAEQELAELTRDIQANGLKEPITALGQEILDGWHRFIGCQQAGVTPVVEQLGRAVDPVQYVLQKNLLRRHLSAADRALCVMLAHDYQPKVGRPEIRTNVLIDLEQPKPTQATMAQEAGVSTKTIQRVIEKQKPVTLPESTPHGGLNSEQPKLSPEQKKRQHLADRVAELEEENAAKQDRIEELEDALADADFGNMGDPEQLRTFKKLRQDATYEISRANALQNQVAAEKKDNRTLSYIIKKLKDFGDAPEAEQQRLNEELRTQLRQVKAQVQQMKAVAQFSTDPDELYKVAAQAKEMRESIEELRD